MADIIDGKSYATRIRGEVGERVARLKAANGLTPGLAVVLVGEEPGEPGLRPQRGAAAVEAGMHSQEHRLAATASEDELLGLIERLNADSKVHGICSFRS